MQASIAEAVNEITIEQKLAALKEIGEQKDIIDRRISELGHFQDPLIIQIGFVGGDGLDTMDINLPEVPSSMIVKVIETYLRSRREELIAHAQELMK